MKLRMLGRWSLYGSILIFTILLVIIVVRSGRAPIGVELMVDRYVEFTLAIVLSVLFTIAILSYETIVGRDSDAT